MIIFIYGEDTYRSHQKLTELLDGFAKKYDPSGLNTTRFREGANAGEVQAAATTAPFLATKRLIVLEGVWGKKITKDLAEPWIELLKSVPETTVLICRETIDAVAKHPIINKFSPNKKPLLPERSEGSPAKREADPLHYPFPAMTLAEAASWIEREVQTQGSQIERGAIQELLARVGPDSGLLSQEIAKLVSYAHGRSVSKNDIEILVVSGIESDIFATMDALSARDVKRAAELLHGRLRAGDNEFYLLTMLAREIRILLMIKDATDGKRPDKSSLAQTLKLHPFIIGKALGNAARFTMEELLRLHQTLFTLDWSVKRGKMTPVLALDLFVAAV